MTCYLFDTKPFWITWTNDELLSIATISNAHNLWWSNQDPSICLLDRVQNLHTENGKLRKITCNIKSKLVQKLYDENIWHVNTRKPVIFQSFIPLTNFVVAILLKFFCFTLDTQISCTHHLINLGYFFNIFSLLNVCFCCVVCFTQEINTS